MDRFLKRVLVALLFLAFAGEAGAVEFIFASAAEAKRILSANDAYMARMSPFDRAARMKSGRAVTAAEFVEFYGSSAMIWRDGEKSRVSAALKKIEPAVTRLELPLPDKVYFIKTSGKEEGNAAYTRANAIVLPPSVMDFDDDELQKLLAHELFHIATRMHPKLAGNLYETIGFHYCGEAVLPAALAVRRISNPDTPRNDYCIQLNLGTEKVLAMPILLSDSPKYDTARGGDFFDYLKLSFLLVETPAGSRTPRILQDARGPRMAGVEQFSGFFEQVGQNTNYIIHPEEILADNFALLVMGGRDVRSPEVLTRMNAVLAKTGEAEKVASARARTVSQRSP